MTTVTGIVTLNNIQIDGRYTVVEVWTDDQSNQFIYDYMSNVSVISPLKYDQAYNEAVAYQAQQAGS